MPLSEMTIKDLVALHNDNVAEEDIIKSWKGRKDDLIPMVQKAVRRNRTVTIREVAEELLTTVDHTNDDGYDVGLPYDTILATILDRFPGAQTSVKSLRWYNTQLNSNPNVKMPIRPRKKAAKPAKAEEPTGKKPQAAPKVKEPELADPLA